MRKTALFLIGAIFPLLVFAQDLPYPSGWINDFAEVINAEYKQKLNSVISELEENTSTEIAVVTINSISPYDEKDYARLLFDNWKPGKKGKDNGVLILVAVKERRWRIEAGYGIEGILPDGLCGEIGRDMVPYFKEGNYGEGLYRAVLKISRIVAQGSTGEVSKKPSESSLALPSLFLSILILGVILFFYLGQFESSGRGSGYRGGYYGSGGFSGGGFGGTGFGGFGGGGGAGGGVLEEVIKMKSFLIILGILAVLAVLITGSFISVYNSIVSKHETITAKWAQVENQLQRRNDLIPNLVNTVKGYAAHEKGVFEEVTLARSQWAKANTVDEKVKAAGAVDSALSRLLLITENYPNLKADQTFLKLMDELAGTENRIAVERMRYNEAVRDYNIAVRTFPGNIISGMFGYKPATEYFKSEDKAKTVPEVKF